MNKIQLVKCSTIPIATLTVSYFLMGRKRTVAEAAVEETATSARKKVAKTAVEDAKPNTAERRVVRIEHCNSWYDTFYILSASYDSNIVHRGVFKRSAAKIAAGLDKEAYTVETSTKKGSFIVHLDSIDEPVVELVGLVRPFTKLRQLDLDEVVEKIKSTK